MVFNGFEMKWQDQQVLGGQHHSPVSRQTWGSDAHRLLHELGRTTDTAFGRKVLIVHRDSAFALGWDSHTLQQTELVYLPFPHSSLCHWTENSIYFILFYLFYSSLYFKINKRRRDPSHSLSCLVHILMMMSPSPCQWLPRPLGYSCPKPSRMPQIPISSLAPQLPLSMVPTPLYEATPLVLGTQVLPGLSKHGSGEALSLRQHWARVPRLPMHCTRNCC